MGVPSASGASAERLPSGLLVGFPDLAVRPRAADRRKGMLTKRGNAHSCEGMLTKRQEVNINLSLLVTLCISFMKQVTILTAIIALLSMHREDFNTIVYKTLIYYLITFLEIENDNRFSNPQTCG